MRALHQFFATLAGTLNLGGFVAPLIVAAFVFSPLIASAAPVNTGLDVNDVSLLFPIKYQKPYPAIGVSTEQLLAPKVFEQVLRFEDPSLALSSLPYLDGKFVGNLDRWYVTSVRFDSCGEVFDLRDEVDPVDRQTIHFAKRANGCQPRLRLVVQPFNLFGNPLATAIHLLYKYDASEVKGVAESLAKLKSMALTETAIDTTGLPLMLHPALVAETKMSTDNFARELKTTLLAVLNRNAQTPSSRLEIVTMTLQVAIDHWKFVGGYVQSGSWRRFVTEFSRQFNDGSNPQLARGVESLACDRHSVCLFQPTFQPAVLQPSGLVLTQIFQDIEAMKELQAPGHRTPALMLDSEKIDDPGQTHFFNTNCVSCHASTNLRDRDGLQSNVPHISGLTPFVPKRHLTPFTNGVINFGYWGTVARVSTRTAADSEVAADSLNRELGITNPAPVRNLNSFWKCLVTETDYKTCL